MGPSSGEQTTGLSVAKQNEALCHPDVKPSPAPGHGIIYVFVVLLLHEYLRFFVLSN